MTFSCIMGNKTQRLQNIVMLTPIQCEILTLLDIKIIVNLIFIATQIQWKNPTFFWRHINVRY